MHLNHAPGYDGNNDDDDATLPIAQRHQRRYVVVVRATTRNRAPKDDSNDDTVVVHYRMVSGHKDDEVHASRVPHVQWAPVAQRFNVQPAPLPVPVPTGLTRRGYGCGSALGHPCSSLRTFNPRGSSLSYWCDT